jgi:MFS family permease
MSETDQQEAAILRRVSLRLVPFLLVAYLVAVIDRTNVGFASIQMNHDIGMTGAAFGFAGGIFFLSYFVFEIPSNLALQRFGASRWLARVMITWGLVAGATAFVTGPTGFLVMRVILGAAEAGFFPGVILYMTYWFPSHYRARMMGWFVLSVPASGIVGSPISGALLQIDGFLGLHGWQWMFVMEALPAVVLGFVAIWWLTDRPEQARWLSADERALLAARLAADRQALAAQQVEHLSFWRLVTNGRVLMLTLICASTVTISAMLGIYQPLIIKGFGVGNIETGLLNAIPYIVACIAMVVCGRHSDRTRERIWHNAIPMLAVVVAMLLTLVAHGLMLNMLLLVVIITGTFACKGPFWALATEALPPSVAAVAIAEINALGSLPGFGASYLIGVIKQATGSFPLSIMPIAALCFLGVVGVLIMGRQARRGSVAAAEIPLATP